MIRRPVIAIISTGDELVTPGNPISPNQTYNANTPALVSLITHYGGIPQVFGKAHDYESSIMPKFRKGFNADMILISGGVSYGDYDLVRLVLDKIGEVKFSRINIGQGAAFVFGIISRTANIKQNASIPVFALSGPPITCLANFETLVRPIILKMMGYKNLQHRSVEAIANDTITNKKTRNFVYLTGTKKVGHNYYVNFSHSEKGCFFTEMAKFNSLNIIPSGSTLNKGDKVKTLMLDWYREFFPDRQFSFHPDKEKVLNTKGTKIEKVESLANNIISDKELENAT